MLVVLPECPTLLPTRIKYCPRIRFKGLDTPKSISIIIPTLNEEQGIGSVIDEIPVQQLRESGFLTEVIVVDSCSRDRTVEIAKSKGARVITEPRLGYFRAYKTGFENAKGDYIATLDADGTYPASEIPRLLAILLSENLIFVTTNRFANILQGSMSAVRQVGNRLLSLAGAVLFGVRLEDLLSGMWVFRKSILDSVQVESNHDGSVEELKIRTNLVSRRIKEFPISYRPRLGKGNQFVPLIHGLRELSAMLRLRFKINGYVSRGPNSILGPSKLSSFNTLVGKGKFWQGKKS